MVFSEDELHCDIFAPVLFSGSLLSHASWQTFIMYYFFHPLLAFFWDPLSLVSLDFKVRFPYMFLAWIFEPMRGVIHFGH